MLKEFLTNLTNPNCTFHSYFLNCSFSYFCFYIIQNLKSYLLDNLASLTHTKAAFAEQNEFNYFYDFVASVWVVFGSAQLSSHMSYLIYYLTLYFFVVLNMPKITPVKWFELWDKSTRSPFISLSHDSQKFCPTLFYIVASVNWGLKVQSIADLSQSGLWVDQYNTLINRDL